MRRWLTLVLSLFLLGACTRSSAPGVGVTQGSGRLPVLKGETVQGGSLDPSYYEGQVTVVNFWATWCGPCEEEQPDLVDVANEYSSRGVVFVGVNYRDNLAAAKTWVDRFDVPYPSIFDPSGSYADDFGFLGLPDTYIVDAQGTIVRTIVGQTDAAELSGLIDEVLAAG